MARTNFEKLRSINCLKNLRIRSGRLCLGGTIFARDTVGKQLVRPPTASEQTSLKEPERDAFRITDDSSELPEVHCTRHSIGFEELTNEGFLRKKQIERLKPIIDELAPKLNAYLKSIGDINDCNSDH